jgi:hypothetical protein
MKEWNFMKGKYKLKVDLRLCGIMNWKDKWKKAKGRWKTNIDIFQDIAAEDLLAYLIIKDKPKDQKVRGEFNWEQLCKMIKKTTSVEFIDNSLQELTEFLILKNGFNETPIEERIFNYPNKSENES